MADKDKGAPAPDDKASAPGAEGADTRPPLPGIRVIAQFARDVSFENPHAPDSLRGDVAPKIEMDVELAARTRPDGLYEVDLKLIASAKREADTLFHVEVLYGGLFQIDGIPAQDMEPVILIECPRYLFPFARRVIADLTAEGGFPPFRVDPIDFAGIYMARRAQLDQQPGGDGASDAGSQLA